MVYQNECIPVIVRSVQPETPGHISVYFERPRLFSYAPGDWIELALPTHQLAGGKVYSLSSSPHEPELRITFKAGLSPFKKALAALRPGDELRIIRHGNDSGFSLKEHQPSVLIAGGVGIAPFRSMLSNMVYTASRDTVRLIYLNTFEDFLYHAEFADWQSALPGLSIHLIATKNLKRKDREKTVGDLLLGSEPQHYIAGPTAMVSNTLTLLKRHGIFMKSIKIDDFGLY
ncbi:MAG TPA: FAD-dependent oxidoreductase [Candidatus Saccharimonadales bacterium]|jgi:ferredoxin-NADP reductase